MQRTIAFAIILLFVAPVAAAGPDLHEMTVDSLGMSGDVTSEAAEVAAISLVGATLADRPGQVQDLRLHAQQGTYTVWAESGVFADTNVAGTLAQAIGEPEPRGGGVDRFDFSLSAVEASHLVNIIIDDAQLTLRGGQLDVTPRPAAGDCMTQAGFITSQSCDGDTTRSGPTLLPLPEVYQYVKNGQSASFKLIGSFIVEVAGVDLDGTESIDAHRQDATAAGSYENKFVRFEVAKGQIDVTFAEDMEFSGFAVTGALDSDILGQVVATTDGDAMTVPGELSMRTTPEADKIHIAAAPQTAPLGGSAAQAPGFSPLWAFLLIIPALIAYGVSRRSASMADIEAALRSGKFTQAARLSRRVLRAEPEHLSAQLSQAIAHTKGGRPAKAVDGVRAYLAKHEPRDGTLHYVMGLALSELGRDDEARNAMQHAVARTPALASEVEMHLRPARYEGAYA